MQVVEGREYKLRHIDYLHLVRMLLDNNVCQFLHIFLCAVDVKSQQIASIDSLWQWSESVVLFHDRSLSGNRKGYSRRAKRGTEANGDLLPCQVEQPQVCFISHFYECFIIFVCSPLVGHSAALGQDLSIPIGQCVRLGWSFFEAVSVSQNVGFLTCLSKTLHHQLRAFLEGRQGTTRMIEAARAIFFAEGYCTRQSMEVARDILKRVLQTGSYQVWPPSSWEGLCKTLMDISFSKCHCHVISSSRSDSSLPYATHASRVGSLSTER